MDAYLAILQLDITKKSSYTSKDIKRAFKKQAMKWHPDRNIKNLERANNKMKDINEAHAYMVKVFENKQTLLDSPDSKPKPKPKPKSEAKPNPKVNVNANSKPKNEAKHRPFIPPKQTRLKKEQEQEQAQAKREQAQSQDAREQRLCLEKDAVFFKDCHYWKGKMAAVTNPNEIDFLLTAKLVYVDLFRCEIEVLPNNATIPLNVIEKIAQIWYQYPISNGNTRYVQSFYNHHIAQCIHGAPESTFYSKAVIRQYLQERAQTVAASNQAITTMGRQELCIILYLLQNIIW